MKRRGFTLIELMVVIAIIIILAAIAIPNYLSMTARAKRSRVASDFAAIATALETYKTDWNQYPPATSVAITTVGTTAYKELVGRDAAGASLTPSVNSGTTPGGETAPISYISGTTLASMVNPYNSANAYLYTGATATWKLSADTGGSVAATRYLVRKDTQPTLVDSANPS